MKIDEQTFQAIADEIHSDTSPVGIDARKTHVLILHQLAEMQKQLNRIEEQLQSKE